MSEKSLLRRIAGWPGKLWGRVRPGPRALRGASWSSAIAAMAIGGLLGSRIRSNEGLWIDVGFGAVLALLGSLLIWPLLVLAMGTLRRSTEVVGRVGFGALIATAFLLDQSGLSVEAGLIAAAALVLPVAMVFGGLASMTGGAWGRAGTLKRGWLTLMVIGGVGAGSWVGWWTLGQNGSTDHLVEVPRRAESDLPPMLSAANPAAPGELDVLQLTYGAGTDRHRAQFGSDVTIKTGTVNAKPFTKLPSGWKGDLRERFWGIEDAGELPLNATVWHPDGPGPYPLVLCVHGNHHMADWSDPGYEYLGRLFASKGYIFCSVDENFLNGSVMHGGMRGENDARGWVLLKHLELWRAWNGESGHRFEGKVDLDNIGLIGHSRGGEAVGHAAVFNRLKLWPDDASVKLDFGFAIKAVVAIAPVDGQYRPTGRFAELEDVSLLVLHGAHDADVSSFYGDRMYRRAKVTGDQFKATVYAYRANHGQFNTVWGDTDSSGPRSFLLNRAALMSGEDQRKIGKVTIAAFLDATLKGRREYVPLLKDLARAREWLPDEVLITRYEDASFEVLADYEEDIDVTTVSADGGTAAAEHLVVFREGDLKHRGGSRREDHAVWLGWNTELEEETATYTLTLPEGFAVGDEPSLVLSLAAADEKPKPKDYGEEDEEEDNDEDESENGDEDDAPLDLSVELVARDGTAARVPLSRFGVIAPPLRAQMTRWSLTEAGYKSDTELVLQTFEIPLTNFPGIAPESVASVRFVFDRCSKGVVVLDRVGFAKAR